MGLPGGTRYNGWHLSGVQFSGNGQPPLFPNSCLKEERWGQAWVSLHPTCSRSSQSRGAAETAWAILAQPCFVALVCSSCSEQSQPVCSVLASQLPVQPHLPGRTPAAPGGPGSGASERVFCKEGPTPRGSEGSGAIHSSPWPVPSSILLPLPSICLYLTSSWASDSLRALRALRHPSTTLPSSGSRSDAHCSLLDAQHVEIIGRMWSLDL